MSATAIIAIIAVCVIVTGMLVGTAFSALILEQLDRLKEDSWVDAHFLFRRAGVQQLLEYRNAYPDGKLHVYALASYAVAMIGAIVLVALAIITMPSHYVLVTSPSDGANFTAPANIIISADVREADFRILRVDFYEGDTLIGSSTTPPYSITWSNVPRGSYSLTANATDDQETTVSSDTVSITVNPPGKAAP